jgi:hypothetical protein
MLKGCDGQSDVRHFGLKRGDAVDRVAAKY